MRRQKQELGSWHSCTHSPSCADSGETKGRADNPDEYLTVPGFMSPSLLQTECLTLVTSGREHTQPGLEQGEQAPGQV